MNTNYAKAVEAVKTLNKKGEGLWAALCLFVHEVRGESEAGKHNKMEGEAMKTFFKTEERVADKDMKVKMGENSTYRVSKGILVKAVELDLSVVDSDGKPVGKTALEKQIKDLETTAPKSPLELFKKAVERAADALDEIDPADMAEVYLATMGLIDQVRAALPASMKV